MKIHTLDTGLFKLDGGAMYGVVPRSMWQKLNPARCQQHVYLGHALPAD